MLNLLEQKKEKEENKINLSSRKNNPQIKQLNSLLVKQETKIEVATLELRLRKSSAVFGCLQSASGKETTEQVGKKARNGIPNIPR